MFVASIFMFIGWRMGQSSMQFQLTKRILQKRNDEIYKYKVGDNIEYAKALYWVLHELNKGNWKKTASRIRSNASKTKK